VPRPTITVRISNRRVIHKQIFLCSEDASITKVPILKETADVTLAILKAVKKIKWNRDAFHELAHYAADLILAIWQSYKKSKIPEQWLSGPLQDILRGLLQNLNSMLVFVEEQASTNLFIRMMYGSIDTQQIDRYHQRLTIIFDKFEIQSQITTNHLLVQLLEKQKEVYNQMQHINDVKNIDAKRVTDKHSKVTATKGTSSRTSICVSSTLRSAGSNKARKKPVKKATRKEKIISQVEHWPLGIEGESDWEEDEVLRSMNPVRKTGGSTVHNVMLPPTSIFDWPWSIAQSHATGNSALPFCPGNNILFNQGIGDIDYSNLLNISNQRSVHYYHYY